MAMLKKDFEEFLSRYSMLIGKTYDISFDKHTDRAVLARIEKQPSTGFKLAPDKRYTAQGKLKTPDMIVFRFEQNTINLVFPVEDINISLTYNPLGFMIECGETTIVAKELIV